MTSEPLQPFSPPSSLGFSGASAGIFLEWILYLVFVFWALYTIIAVYHWLKYSHASFVAVPAILVHLGVSLVLMGYALSGALYV